MFRRQTFWRENLKKFAQSFHWQFYWQKILREFHLKIFSPNITKYTTLYKLPNMLTPNIFFLNNKTFESRNIRFVQDGVFHDDISLNSSAALKLNEQLENYSQKWEKQLKICTNATFLHYIETMKTFYIAIFKKIYMDECFKTQVSKLS